MPPRLTIGMAHYMDFDGVYFTIQALRLYNPALMKDVEFVVVDNSPTSPHGRDVKGVVDTIRGSVASAKYIDMPGPVGTSPARNRIFQEATGDIVLAMDCHILLQPGALESLLQHYEEHPGCRDLIQGPMLYDSLQMAATHFDDQWRSEMWGTWGQAWQCDCGPEGIRIAFTEGKQYAIPRLLGPGNVAVEKCDACGREVPINVGWNGHERVIELMGFHRLGMKTGPAFPIPGQGLGLFSCRREAWLGFHPEARGFGGEEMYIHEKYRKAGAQALCLPDLRWVHRFGRPEGVKYPIARWFKIRNYVLELQELGMDLDPVYQHFVALGLCRQDSWEKLVKDAAALQAEPSQDSNPNCPTGCGQTPSIPDYQSVEEIYTELLPKTRDLNEHMPKFRELAAQVDRVTEFSARRESSIAFMAAKPKSFTSYNTELDLTAAKARDLAVIDGMKYKHSLEINNVPEIDETDLVFIDTQHTFGVVRNQLERYGLKSTRFIVLHDTQIFGMTGDDGQMGILEAVRQFVRAHPEWSVIYHTAVQYGLTVLSCSPEDKPKLPSVFTLAANFAKAQLAYVADGLTDVTSEQREERLGVCSLCVHRVEGKCSVCGCPVEEKAKRRSQDCPLALWPLVTEPAPAAKTQEGGEV